MEFLALELKEFANLENKSARLRGNTSISPTRHFSPCPPHRSPRLARQCPSLHHH